MTTKEEARLLYEEQMRLMKEITKDREAYHRLQAKAKWEHMTLYGTLREWGDPREW